jgi:hypothetical protein
MDGRRNNGGNKNAGRKPKAEEAKLIERLDNIINRDEVIEMLGKKIKDGDQRAMTLYFNYRYGKPKESVDITSEGFNINFKDIIKYK